MNRPLRKLCLALLAVALVFANSSALAQDFKVRTEFPSTDGRVYAIAADDFNRVIYIGGAFDNVGGQPRAKLAAIDMDTGALLPFAPVLNGTVFTLAFTGTTLYVGGQFTDVGGTARKRAAAFNTNDGTLLAWNPDVANGNVFTLALDVANNYVFLGGDFTQVGAVASFRLANVNGTNGAAVNANWTPNPEAAVNAIATYNGFAYTGGDFTTIGGKPYKYLASVDGGNSDGSAFTGWSPSPDAAVSALLFDDTKLYVGGVFFGLGFDVRLRLARVDRSTGVLDPSFPTFGINERVKALAITGSHLYFGGFFTEAGGVERKFLASIDTATNTLKSWNPSSDSSVDALLVDGYTVYAGGNFTTIGGVSRTGFAAIIDYSLPGAPSPDKPSAGTPTVTVIGKKKITTSKSSLTLKGTSTNAAKVEVKVGKTGYKPAKGSSSWSFKAKLKPGKNVILVRAASSTGKQSAAVKITVTRS